MQTVKFGQGSFTLGLNLNIDWTFPSDYPENRTVLAHCGPFTLSVEVALKLAVLQDTLSIERVEGRSALFKVFYFLYSASAPLNYCAVFNPQPF